MTTHLPRLVLGLLAALTLVLSVGGAVGIWPTGAPASRWGEPAAAQFPSRDMEGAHGDIRRAETAQPQAPAQPDAEQPASPQDLTLPKGSGEGRRVVFDLSRQRVWLVGPAGKVRRSYLVSGSETDNLGPGQYQVYSKSRHAVSYTYEETMQYMVRFTQGERAAIGFHDIPRDQQGQPVQTRDQLGERLSSGCIRQARPDAIALWRFTDIGTEVVVVD